MIYANYLILQHQKTLYTLSSFFTKAGYLVCLSENTNKVGYYIFLRMLLATIQFLSKTLLISFVIHDHFLQTYAVLLY